MEQKKGLCSGCHRGVKAHHDKVAYYDEPEIRVWVSALMGVTHISFSVVAANWWGVVTSRCRLSEVSSKIVQLGYFFLAVQICEETFHVHCCFGQSTY